AGNDQIRFLLATTDSDGDGIGSRERVVGFIALIDLVLIVDDRCTVVGSCRQGWNREGARAGCAVVDVERAEGAVADAGAVGGHVGAGGYVEAHAETSGCGVALILDSRDEC